MSNVVGIYVRQASVWERANGGTPAGYSGPQVYKSAAWNNAVEVFGYPVTGWFACWGNIDNELLAQNRSSEDYDFTSPYFAEVGITVEGAIADDAGWRNYDCGREYEVQFVDQATHNLDTVPSLSSWLNLTDPDTVHTFSSSRTAPGVESGDFDAIFREKAVGGSGHKTADYHLQLEIVFDGGG